MKFVPSNPDVRVAVVGYGYWGSKHMRVLSSMPGVRVTIVDEDPERIAEAKRSYPSAAASGVHLMAGHTFEYNAAVWKLKEIIDSIDPAGADRVREVAS
ncbi:MAG: hypothetical protein ACRDRS_14080 [Pseudonocardiaceae bacterium]